MTDLYKGFTLVWRRPGFSEILTLGVIRVDAGVSADVEDLVAFLGGDSPTFGYKVEIVGVGDEEWAIPKVKRRKDGSQYIAKTLSFSTPLRDKNRTRYYEVMINRD